MQEIVGVTFPFFALVLAGYLAADRGALPEAAIPGLNAFVLYFALPCMLFRFGMNTPLAQLFNPVIVGIYAACALVIVFFTIAITRGRHRVRLRDAAFGALAAAFPNTGFMGVPLLVTLLGPAAAGPVICTILVDLFLTSSLCIAIARAHAAPGEGGAWAAASHAVRGALSNPLPWAIALGALLGWAQLVLPKPVEATIGMLADAASPVALFTIGAVLWRSGAHAGKPRPQPLDLVLDTGPHSPSGARREQGPRTRPGLPWGPGVPPARYVPVAAVKLLLHPLLIFLAGASARALGLPLSPFEILTLTLAAALPSASSISPLAERFGVDNGRIAKIILSSTVLSFATFTAIAWLLGLRQGT
jgi:malonate transporter and related proteins